MPIKIHLFKPSDSIQTFPILISVSISFFILIFVRSVVISKCKWCQHIIRDKLATEPKAFAFARHCDCTFVCRNSYGPWPAMSLCMCVRLCFSALSLSNGKMAGAKGEFDFWTTQKTVESIGGKRTHFKKNCWQLIEANNMAWNKTANVSKCLSKREREISENEEERRMNGKEERKSENNKIYDGHSGWWSAISFLFFSLFPWVLFTCFQYYAMVWASSTESHCLYGQAAH